MQAEPQAELQLVLDGSFQRLLAHGLAQFHHLMSKSQDEQDGRITLVRHKHGEDSQQLLDKPADISCADILAALEAQPEGGMHSRRLSRFVRGHATGEDTDSVAPSDYCPGPSSIALEQAPSLPEAC